MMLAWGGFEKYIKYIASLVCVVLLISPLRSIDMSFISDAEYGVSSESTEEASDIYAMTAALTEQSAEKYISDLVFSEFGIKAVTADIKIEWSKNEAVIESIVLVLSKGDMNRSDDVKKYLFSVLGGEVTVVEER